MPMSRFFIAATALAALAAGSAAYAQADQPPPRDGAPAYGAGPERKPDQREPGQRGPAAREERVRLLHDSLNLRADQEGPWQALQDALRPDRGTGEGRGRDLQAAREMSTPERLDLMQRRMQEQQARFDERARAIKRFYAVLDPAQRRTLDALIQLHAERVFGGRAVRRGEG